MESRRLITAFLAAMAAYLLWVTVAPYILPKSWLARPRPVATAPAPAESQPELAQTQPAVAPSTAPVSTQPAVVHGAEPATRPANTQLVEGKSTQAIALGSADEHGAFP